MTLALEVGRRARVWSAPNPAVGCAIVRDDALLSSGFKNRSFRYFIYECKFVYGYKFVSYFNRF